MTITRLADLTVGRIVVEPIRVERFVRSVGRITGPDEAIVPMTTFDVFGWRDLMYLVNGVRHQRGIDKDDVGFRYPGDERDPGEESFDDVDVYNPVGEVLVSVPAFERLASRYFRALIEGVARFDDPRLSRALVPRVRRCHRADRAAGLVTGGSHQPDRAPQAAVDGQATR